VNRKIESSTWRIIDVGQSMPQSARRNSSAAISQNNSVEARSFKMPPHGQIAPHERQKCLI
jgi:hypothetical protein